jgi:hypothetical protein
MNQRDIDAARQAGILDERKAAELVAFFQDRHVQSTGDVTEEQTLRFLSNFNDIFISIGLIILSIGVMMASGTLFGDTGNAFIILSPILVVMWLLLEYFAGRRRLVLPSMTLSVLFTFTFTLLAALWANGLGDLESASNTFSINTSDSFDTIKGVALWSAGGAAIGAGLIFFRFRLPFSLFLIALSIAAGLYTEAFSNGNVSSIYSGTASLIIGLVTLIVAVLFDVRDPQRKTLNADNAFWLHLAAAPQVMLGLRAIFSGSTFDTLSAGEAIPLLIALAVFSVLSLALNRRALIAAGLLSFWLAISAITDQSMSGTTQISISLLLLGGGIVLLGAGWKTARRIVLAFMPKHGIFARIFPPETA